MSVLRVELSSHDDTPFRIETATGLVLDDGAQFRREPVGWNHLEPQSRVEWHVPRYIAEGRQRDRLIPFAHRPIADRLHEFAAESAASVIRVNIDLIEMRGRWLEYLDVREPYWKVVRERDPQLAIALDSFQNFLARCLGQNGFWCVAGKKPGGGELDGWQQWQIGWSCRSDSVDSRRHVVAIWELQFDSFGS